MTKTPAATPRRKVVLHTGSESRVLQSDTDMVNINRVVAELVSGNADQVPMARGIPSYIDVSDSSDLQSAINLARQAQFEFDQLPATVRFAAQNNPVQFLDMINTQEGQDALQAAGLPFNDGATAPSLDAPPVVPDGAVAPSMESPESDS